MQIYVEEFPFFQSLDTKVITIESLPKICIYPKEVDKEEKLNYLMCFAAKTQGRQATGWQQLQTTWHRQPSRRVRLKVEQQCAGVNNL